MTIFKEVGICEEYPTGLIELVKTAYPDDLYVYAILFNLKKLARDKYYFQAGDYRPHYAAIRVSYIPSKYWLKPRPGKRKFQFPIQFDFAWIPVER